MSIVFVVWKKKKTKVIPPKRWSVKIELDETEDISTSQVTCYNVHCAVISKNILARDHSRFFDQVGHQTTNTSIGNKHFFTK